MEITDLMRYLRHLVYMCMHSTTSNYTDEVYRAVTGRSGRKRRRKDGGLFQMGDNGLSLLHCNMDNSKSHKEGSRQLGSDSAVLWK